jgi:hypothetical protein
MDDGDQLQDLVDPLQVLEVKPGERHSAAPDIIISMVERVVEMVRQA